MMRITHRTLAAAGAVAFAAGSAQAQISFTPAGTLPAAQRPSGVAIADFNGDGVADLAVTTDTPDKISIFLGTGGGAFGAPVNILTGAGTGPESIVAADVDGDGDQDLAVVLKNVNTLRLYINTGGVFAAGASATLGANARGLITADFNGDGRPDFATANRDSNSVSVVLNTAGGLTATTLPAGTEPRAVAAADIDGDGDRDLAVTNHRDRTVTIYRNTGGAFSAVQTINVAPGGVFRPEGIVGGDFDRDGDQDFVVVLSDSAVPNQVGLLRNTGGTFAAPVNYPTGALNSGRIVAADFSGDGALDLAVANEDSGNVSVLANSGAGAFGAPLLIATGAFPEALAAGRVNADALPDLVVANRDSNAVSVLLNGARPTSTATVRRTCRTSWPSSRRSPRAARTPTLTATAR
jgi:hypothetical protein